MTYLPSPWPNKRAVGASYCIDQAPSAEMVSGLTVTLRPPRGATGTIVVPAGQENWVTRAPLEQSLVEQLAEWAEKGVRAAADELGVDLSTMDVEFSQIAFHPVDSRLALYPEAAACAFRSAWAAWCRFRREDR